MTRTEFFETIQHRTILPCELTFDIDDRTLGKGMIFPNIKAKARFIYNQLKNKHKLNPVVYWTGSKSYHLTTIIPELRYLPYNERREYRANLLSLYACDGLKASESCPIACEGTIHYKSGKRKEVVEL